MTEPTEPTDVPAEPLGPQTGPPLRVQTRQERDPAGRLVTHLLLQVGALTCALTIDGSSIASLRGLLDEALGQADAAYRREKLGLVIPGDPRFGGVPDTGAGTGHNGSRG